MCLIELQTQKTPEADKPGVKGISIMFVYLVRLIAPVTLFIHIFTGFELYKEAKDYHGVKSILDSYGCQII